MKRTGSFLAVALLLAWVANASSQVPRSAPRSKPRLEPVAETRLLMEGLLATNHRALTRNLSQKPDDEGWTFSRGQGLLVAETGNLLMLRPPRGQGGDDWMELCADLRDRGTRLARAAADKDLTRCRQAFLDLTATCNRCHQTFRVRTKITVGEREGE